MTKQASGDFVEFTGTFKEAIEKSLREQPMTTLAMGAGVGLVLGALWKR